jgi:riboflavin kinase/FMN adenylyltransferase
VRVDTPAAKQLPGVMNIGKRPTVDGLNTTVEVHLLDWDGNLYGQQLTVYLHQFLRSEQKFPSLTALTNQIQADCDTARVFYNLKN